MWESDPKFFPLSIILTFFESLQDPKNREERKRKNLSTNNNYNNKTSREKQKTHLFRECVCVCVCIWGWEETCQEEGLWFRSFHHQIPLLSKWIESDKSFLRAKEAAFDIKATQESHSASLSLSLSLFLTYSPNLHF